MKSSVAGAFLSKQLIKMREIVKYVVFHNLSEIGEDDMQYGTRFRCVVAIGNEVGFSRVHCIHARQSKVFAGCVFGHDRYQTQPHRLSCIFAPWTIYIECMWSGE